MLVVAVYSKALQIYYNILIVLVPARLESVSTVPFNLATSGELVKMIREKSALGPIVF